MKIITTENSLIFIADDEDTEDLQNLKYRAGNDDVQFLADMLEFFGYSANGLLYPINPEDVGALTDAPMLTDDRDIKDDGHVKVTGNIYWYPTYETLNFADVLIKHGSVEFNKA